MDCGGARRAIRLTVLLALAAALLVGAVACGPFGGGSAASPSATAAVAGGTGTPAAGATATATASPTAAPLPPGVHVTIDTNDLNVRTGPSLDGVVVGRLQPGDAVSVVGKSEDGDWLALGGLGWAFYTQGWYTPDPDVSALKVLPATAIAPPTYDPGTTSGFPAIDEIAARVAQGDAAALAQAANPGLQVQACDSGQWSAAQPQDAIAKLLAAGKSLRLYAVYAAPKEASDATFVVVFGSDAGAGAALWLGKTGGIARVAAGCQKSAADYLPPARGDQPTYYVRPNTPAPLHPAH